MHAWDEAWAFYAGSLEGSLGNSEGRMLYRLVEFIHLFNLFLFYFNMNLMDEDALQAGTEEM